MKHIKRFNESREFDERSFGDICNQHLSYILDDDTFSINVSSGVYSFEYDKEVFVMKLENKISGLNAGTSTGFSWLDIKEEFITFVNFLKSKLSNLIPY